MARKSQDNYVLTRPIKLRLQGMGYAMNCHICAHRSFFPKSLVQVEVNYITDKQRVPLTLLGF